MSSPSGVKTRGVGDSRDLQPSILFYPAYSYYSLEVQPGVFYLNNERQVMFAQGWYESLPGNSTWLRSYTLPRSASEPVRVLRVMARVDNEWKSLTPVYNAVAFMHASHWTQRADGLWQAPIQLVYPTHLYSATGEGYYRVDRLEDIGEHRYVVDEGAQMVIAPVPGLLMDGLRTSPTVEVQERVLPNGDGVVVTRWPAAVHPNTGQPLCAYLMYSDGSCYIPETVEGNVWRFPSRVPPHTGVARYFVMNSYCLFGDVLEVFTEPCGEVRVWYDVALSDTPLEFFPYQIRRNLQGGKLMCVVPYNVSHSSPPLVTGNTPVSIELYDLVEHPKGIDRMVMNVGCRVLDRHGNGVASVSVQLSSPTPGVTITAPNGTTDIHGFYSTPVVLSAPTESFQIDVHCTGYSVSSSRWYSPTSVQSGVSGLVHSVVWERFAQRDGETDMLVICFAQADGLPTTLGSIAVTCLDGASVRVAGQSEAVSELEMTMDDLPAEGMLILYVPRQPVTLLLQIRSVPAQKGASAAFSEILLEDV